LLALYDFKNWTGIRKNVAKFIFNNADVIFVEGDNGMNDLLGLRPIKTRIEKFNHWVDQDIFKPDESKDTRGKKFILFVGRPIKEKGIEVVRGAERILKDNNKYEFIYIENTPHKDLPKYYQMADIVVIPSLYPEGFSRVVAEAASCGCAVITSDRGSLPEMVREFGMSIEMTPENLAEEIRDVCQEDKFSRLYSMRYSSYDYAVDNFSTKNAEGFLNAYKQ
jgi:glycosyltransferase involved in cell wall biosynthesis